MDFMSTPTQWKHTMSFFWATKGRWNFSARYCGDPARGRRTFNCRVVAVMVDMRVGGRTLEAGVVGVLAEGLELLTVDGRVPRGGQQALEVGE